MSNIFAEKYKELYNSAPLNDNVLSDFQTKVNILINDKCCTNNCNLYHLTTKTDIVRGIKKSKADKSDGTSDFNSNYLLHA